MEPLYEIDLGQGQGAPVERVEVMEEVGHHQVVVLTHVGSLTLPGGQPVYLRWGHSVKREFVGYVSHTKPRPNQDSPRVDIVCVGATRPLKNAQQRSWRDTTLTRIAKTIASEHWLEALVHDDGQVMTSMQPGDVSSWTYLRDLAESAGLLLVADNTRVKIIDPVKALNGDHVQAVYYHRLPHRSFGRVRALDADIGTASPRAGSGEQQRLFSVDERGSVVGAAVSGQGGFTRYPTSPATSQDDAKQRLSRAERREQMTHEARLTVDGFAAHAPGKIVILDGYARDVNGFWVVTRARHRLEYGRYETELTVRRAQASASEPLYSYAQHRPLSLTTVGGDRRSQSSPRSRLVEYTWRAA